MGRKSDGSKKRRMPLWKRIALNAAALVIIALAISPFWVADTPSIFDEDRSLHEAMSEADANGRVVVAVVTADFCLRCQIYKRGALTDARVEEWMRSNAETAYVTWPFDSDAMKILQTRSFPMTVVMRDDEVIAQKNGALSAEELLFFLQEATSAPNVSARF